MTDEPSLDLDEIVFVSHLHQRIPAVLDELDHEAERIMVTCNDDECAWFTIYYPQPHREIEDESISMMAARMDADVVKHTRETDGEHDDYDIGIDVKSPVEEIDVTITVGDTDG